jgi:penicillin-insensitive murein DD-endopeptidase
MRFVRPMRLLEAAGALAAILALTSPGRATAADAEWGSLRKPSEGPAQVFGGHARGCLAGAVALPLDGPGYQVMRLSRNRFWGHPELIAFVGEFAAAMQAKGWPDLLVGDLAQPRGGPMSVGHRSHQIGLDVDIWLSPAPFPRLSDSEREELSAISYVNASGDGVEQSVWTSGYADLLRTAASFPAVDRIFVNPAIKRELCASVDGDRTWLARIRPWWGHDSHFHVGLRCPAGETECLDRQPPVPSGDGCDEQLAWWFSEEARAQMRTPSAPAPRPSLDELPPACRSLFEQSEPATADQR